MSGNISAVAIKHPIPPIVLFIILTLAGLLAFLTMDITQNPDIDVPIVNVYVSRPSAAPSELETQITRKVEDAVATIQNIKRIRSSINDGRSSTTIEFEIGTNIDRATNDVRDAVARIRQDLPQDIYEPQVQRVNFSGNEVLFYAVSSKNRTVEQLSWLVDNEISRGLQALQGVGQVERSGGLQREIRIHLDPTRLMALGITADDVNNQLRAMNVDLPGGRGTVGSSEQTIRTLGSARSVDDLRNTEIALPNGRKARLSDMATVIDGMSELRQTARLDGEPVVTFSVYRAPQSSEITVAKLIEKKVEEFKEQFPDVRFETVFRGVDFVQHSYDASVEALVLGAGLAILVVLWFLGDWRATVIAAVAMPLSMIPTFIAMQALGFTLNGITMLALALVTGILVDDAIVEIENIVRHIRMGKRPYQAALEAADEIGLAVVATTMTIVATFLPVSFMPGIPGQFFKSFGITVAVAVMFSLLVARLITPLMSAYFLAPAQKEHGTPKWIDKYLHLLDWCLAHRLKTIGITLAVFGLSIFLATKIPQGFIPDQDIGFSQFEAELPPGVTLQETDALMQRFAMMFKAQPEVRAVWAVAGRGGDIRRGRALVLLKPKSERTRSQKDFERAMAPELLKFPGVRSGFASTSGVGGKDVQVVLVSDDGQALERHADKVMSEMQKLPAIANIMSTAALQRPELIIKPKFDRAAEQGVSVASIGQVARIATLGDIDSNTAKYNLGERQVPIRVTLDPSWRTDLDTIENLRVRTFSGTTVPLKSVAEIVMGSGPSQIDRFARSRKAEIQADLAKGELSDAFKQVNDLPSIKNLPPGIRKANIGNQEEMGVMFRGFMVALATALLLNLAVLVLLFRNFFQPPTILVALPLSLCGALAALMFSNLALSLPAMIGILMLMGIVTKNSILLVEYAIVAMRDHGKSMHDALMDAGHKRARPIVMTTIAMIAGMIPIAAGWGEDGDFRQPMAIAVIGGLITSTALSLVVIPVVFTYMDQLQNWLAPKMGRILTPKDGHTRPHAVQAGD
ncbi:efflux RND transporter permease subunit [Roseiterribacter gracilis]|uniref:Acriflavine resistance protein B n=1 Tax=Roseiterribacter gracilis TaxID=2812848 RepID=A0A8S8XEJ3_9PROT|nr:acriflavine resistance protein B [Rhodospirillales bacterium TMPK1]